MIPIYLVCQRMAMNRRMVELKHLSFCYHNILDVKLNYKKINYKTFKNFFSASFRADLEMLPLN